MTTLARRATACAIALASPCWTLAQSSATHAVPYRLEPESQYQEGCFDPCMCPYQFSGGMRGTMVLVPRGFDGLFHNYDVVNVSWSAELNGSRVDVRGSGTYRVGGEFAAEQQLVLDLRAGDLPSERYDSGLALGGGGFPVLEVQLPTLDVHCPDRVLEVRARPATILLVDHTGAYWGSEGATAYDLVWGSLEQLRVTGGDFSSATGGCVANDWPDTTVPFQLETAPGECRWFVLRDNVASTYDTDAPSQVASRDAGIHASPAACP